MPVIFMIKHSGMQLFWQSGAIPSFSRPNTIIQSKSLQRAVQL
jgi:hypothetical protein